MAEQRCPQCGKPNPASATFCAACDEYLGWTQVIHLPQQVPQPRQAPTGATHDGPGPSTGATAPRPPATPPPSSLAQAPAVSVATAEVVVTPDAPGSFEIGVKNGSTIVDSYLVHAVDPPRWLGVAHGDTNLMPEGVRQVPVTLSVQPGSVALAQRLTVPLHVRSRVDPTKYTEITVDVVVPRSGPPATLLAHPTLIRLEDTGHGTFALRLDNRRANFARRYRLSASDPEGAVAFDFVPPLVDVPGGGTSETTVRFAARQPAAGGQVTRQLTVTATADDGVVETQVALAQRTSPEPERVPVRLQLTPSHVAAVDSPTAALELIVDNRAGHQAASLDLVGRDPANVVTFSFDRTSLTVAPGRAARVRVLLRSRPPEPGTSVSRPFAIVGSDGGSQVEATGTFELTARPAAISSARIRLLPEHLVVSARRGRFTVEVDNRYGVEPLQVRLSGSDEFGRARLAFLPADVTVPAGQVGRASVTVEHPRPAGGTSASRRIQVVASAGSDTITDEAVFTQHVASHRRLWGVLLVLLGALLVGLGAVTVVDPALEGVDQDVRTLVQNAQDTQMPEAEPVRQVVAAGALGVLGLCVVVMLFGLIGRTGRSIRFGAVLGALAAIASGVAVSATAAGAPWVLVGAVLAFVGSILIRPPS